MAGPSYWHEFRQDHSTNRSDGLSGSCHEEGLPSCSSPPNETETTTTPRANKTRKSSAGSSSQSPYHTFVPPPPRSEQKLLRRKDPSIVPGASYLHISWALDVLCDDIPILRNACPDADVGGWRSLLPNPEWGTFPDGKLSHSFEITWSKHKVRKDLTFGGYVRSLEAPKTITKGGAPGDDSGGGRGIAATLGNYYDFAFRTDNTTLGNLTHPSTLAVLFVLVLLMRSLKRLLLPRFTALGRRLGQSAHGPGWDEENAERVAKFGEYLWRLLYHTSLAAYGVWYFRDKPWWDPARGGTRHFFEDHGFQTLEPGMAWYYLVQGAYNVDALVSLVELSFAFEWVNPLAYSSALGLLEKEDAADDRRCERELAEATAGLERRTILWTPLFEVKWSPTVREDFNEMFAHHLVTNFLIFKSSHYKFTRVGSVVFLLHDLSDVPVDLSKLVYFVKWEVSQVVCFFTMCAVWVVTRLYLFPSRVIKTVAMELHEYVVVRGIVDPAWYDAGYQFMVPALVALLLLHIFWFMILLKIGWKFLSKGERHDYSEFKNGKDSSKKDR